MFTAMKDMARSPEEMKADTAMPMVVAEKAKGPVYPYGLSLCLNDETLKKLGIEGDLPDVGDMIHLIAMGRVTCASENEMAMEGGGKKVERRIEIQITHMACEDEDQEVPARGEKWYRGGNEESDEGEAA